MRDTPRRFLMSLRTLPAPDDGWRPLARLTALVALSAFIAAFALTGLLLPTMDIECWSNAEGATICPHPDSRDPRLAHLLDARWPSVGAADLAVALFAFAALLLAIGGTAFLATASPWEGLGAGPDAMGLWAGLGGAGAGLVVAGCGFLHPLAAAAIIGAGFLLLLTAALGLRHATRSLRRRHAAHVRRRDLRARGRRSIARVVDVRWLTGAGTTDVLVFDVTARIRRQGGEVRGILRVPREEAPVVGGSVVVFSDGSPDHPTGIAVVLESDPRSPRHPDPWAAYPDLSAY